MMIGLFVLGNGFEDTEAIATLDVLFRGKIRLELASLSDSLDVKSQCGLNIKSTILLKDVDSCNYDFIVIPGGRAVFDVLDNSELLSNLINDFAKSNKLVASICAGPTQVGKLGLFKDQSFTCFPTTETHIKIGNHNRELGVVRSNNFITAKAMGYSIDFGLEILEYLKGIEERQRVKKSIFGEI